MNDLERVYKAGMDVLLTLISRDRKAVHAFLDSIGFEVEKMVNFDFCTLKGVIFFIRRVDMITFFLGLSENG